MISRKALLISSPSGAGCGVPGGNTDLQTTRNFLLSPRGGAWSDDEIVVLEGPGLAAVTEAVKGMKADYTITWFAGTSFSDPEGRRFLVLNDGDFFQDTELLNDSEKQLVLVDGCPDAFSEEVIHFVGKPDEFQLARRMYDKWIERCESGQVIMHASEAGPGSTSPKAGAFTQKLLLLGSKVPPVENRFNLKSILAAGHELPVLLQEDGLEQSPNITHSIGNAKLPFALALPILKNKGGAGGEAFSSFALGLILLGLLFGAE
jgi:hypothetical protein